MNITYHNKTINLSIIDLSINKINKKHYKDARVITSPKFTNNNINVFVKCVMSIVNYYYANENKELFEIGMNMQIQKMKKIFIDKKKFNKNEMNMKYDYNKYISLFDTYYSKSFINVINSFKNLKAPITQKVSKDSNECIKKYIKSIENNNIPIDLFILSTMNHNINKRVMTFMNKIFKTSMYDYWFNIFLEDIFILNKFEECLNDYDKFVLEYNNDTIMSIVNKYFKIKT